MPPYIRRRRAGEDVAVTDGLITSTVILLGDRGVLVADGLITSVTTIQGSVAGDVAVTDGLITSATVIVGNVVIDTFVTDGLLTSVTTLHGAIALDVAHVTSTLTSLTSLFGTFSNTVTTTSVISADRRVFILFSKQIAMATDTTRRGFIKDSKRRTFKV